MIKPILIRPNEVRGIVSMDEAIEAVQMGFREWGSNPQINAPRRRIHVPSGFSHCRGRINRLCFRKLYQHDFGQLECWRQLV